MSPNHPGQIPKLPIPGVKNLIAVGSGKGGVGKTTVAVNLAVGLAALGHSSGLMDADVYGPNVPLMMGINRAPMAHGERIQPLDQYGVKLMSMGFLLEDSSPVIVRGPIATRYTQQFLRQVAWDNLDVLVLDLPPGTGDIQLTIVQTVALDGAVIVTTPQEIALIDARKAVAMFQKVNVPLLGIVENMSYFVCGHCGERTEIFAHGGGERAAEKLGVPFLGRVPIDPAIREGGDTGRPLVIAHPESPQAKAFRDIAAKIMAQLGKREQQGTGRIESLLKKIKRPPSN